MMYLNHFSVCLRDLDNEKIGAETFGELCNVVLEENGTNKEVKGNN